MSLEPVLIVLVVMLVPISIVCCITFAHVMGPVAERLADLVEIQHRALGAGTPTADPAVAEDIERRLRHLEDRLELTESLPTDRDTIQPGSSLRRAAMRAKDEIPHGEEVA